MQDARCDEEAHTDGVAPEVPNPENGQTKGVAPSFLRERGFRRGWREGHDIAVARYDDAALDVAPHLNPARSGVMALQR